MPESRPRSSLRAAQSGSSSVFLLLGLALLGATALGWWLVQGQGEGTTAVDQDRVVEVSRREVLDSVTASGRVEPVARVAVMSRASGIIKALFVEEGDVVEAEQVLAELDREQLEAQLAQDEADFLAAAARVEGAKARVAEAEVRIADPAVEFLRREVERLDELHVRGDVSDRERDEAARALASAEYQVKLTEANLPVLRASQTEAEAGLASAQADLDRSRTALEEATILSPIDGVVLVRDKEVGDGLSSILTAGGNATQLMTLGDLSVMHIEARVDEVDLGRIHVDMPALITVDAHRGTTLDGRVERIAPAGSVDGNGIVTFEVKIAVEDPEGLLRPDMTADAKLVIDRRPDVLVLPQIAVSRGEGGSWWVQRVLGEGADADLERVQVELGLSDGLLTEVVSGLAEGDRVLLPTARLGGRGRP